MRVSAYQFVFLLTAWLGLFFSLSAQVNPSDSTEFTLDEIQSDSTSTPPDSSQSLSTDSSYATSVPQEDGILDREVVYDARDSIIMSPTGNTIELWNEAVVDYGDIKVEGGYIRIEFNRNELFTRGIRDSTGEIVQKPIFTQGGKKYRADSMTYNFSTRKAYIRKIITQEGEGFLHGKAVKKNADKSFYIKDASFTTCSHEHPHFRIVTPKAKVIPGEKVVTQFAFIEVMDIPTPLMVPFGFFPTTSKRKSGLVLPTYGSSQFRGYFLRDLGFYWAASDQFDVLLSGDIYTQGGYALKAKSSYKKRYQYSGSFKAQYSLFRFGREEFQKFIPEAFDNRSDFQISWNHSQDPKANPFFNFRGNVNIATSNFYKVNSVNPNEVLENRLNSSVSITKSWPDKPFNLTASLNHNQNNQNQDLSLTLPQVNFSVNRFSPFERKNSAGKEKWYEKINMSYRADAKNQIDTRLGEPIFTESVFRDSSNMGIQHSLPISANYKAFNYFVFNPQINYNEYWYPSKLRYAFDDSLNAPVVVDTLNGFQANRSFSFNAGLNTNLYGLFRFNGFVKAMRHVFTPSMNFTYRPDFSTDFWGFYQTFRDTSGREVKANQFRDGIFGSAPQGEQGRINFNFKNTLEVKVRDDSDSSGLKKVKILEGLSLGTNYTLDREKFAWSTINLGARSSALDGLLRFQYSATLDPYGFNEELNKRVNNSAWVVNDKLVRFTNQDLTLGLNLTPQSLGWGKGAKKKKKDKKSSEEKSADLGITEGDIDYYNLPGYVDFDVPWTLDVNYNLNRNSRGGREPTVTQALDFSGNVELTKKWKVGFRSGYDFQADDFTYTSLDFYRNLHCWQLSFNWVPFGFQQSYSLTIQVKANMLSDLKLERQRRRGDFRR